jgi:hypothetical protein
MPPKDSPVIHLADFGISACMGFGLMIALMFIAAANLPLSVLDHLKPAFMLCAAVTTVGCYFYLDWKARDS